MPVLAIVSTAGTASAAAGLCPLGCVCLVPRSGTAPQVVREEDGRTFSPPPAVREVDNGTPLTSCVFSQASFGLPPGGSLSGVRRNSGTGGNLPGPGGNWVAKAEDDRRSVA